jgi:hypothetical protein
MGMNNVPHITQRCAPRVGYMKLGRIPPAWEEKPRWKGKYNSREKIPSGRASRIKSSRRDQFQPSSRAR